MAGYSFSGGSIGQLRCHVISAENCAVFLPEFFSEAQQYLSRFRVAHRSLGMRLSARRCERQICRDNPADKFSIGPLGAIFLLLHLVLDHER